MPKVVVTSGSFSRSAELRNTLLKDFPGAKFNAEEKRFTFEELVAFLGDADAAIVGLEKIDEALLRRCPKLKIVAKYGVGLDNIDQEALKRANVRLGWTGGVNAYSVAEQTMGLMIGLARNLYTGSNHLKAGTWLKRGGIEIRGKKVGIVGVGFIGKEVTKLLKAFGAHPLLNDIENCSAFATEIGATVVTQEELFRSSDIVTLHIPHTTETNQLINQKTLSLMKPTALLINTSRGGVVHQADLKAALKNGIIAGAALDVYEEEPCVDREFLSLPNLICTPHIAGNSAEAVQAMAMAAIDGLKRAWA